MSVQGPLPSFLVHSGPGHEEASGSVQRLCVQVLKWDKAGVVPRPMGSPSRGGQRQA